MTTKSEQMNTLIRMRRRPTHRLVSEQGQVRIVTSEAAKNDNGAQDGDSAEAAHERQEDSKR